MRVESSGDQRDTNRAMQAVLKVLEDPVGGLLRVVELFEARRPKGLAIVSDLDGVVAEIDDRGFRRVVIHSEQPIAGGRQKLKGETLAETIKAEDGTVLAERGVELTDKLLRNLRKSKVKTLAIPSPWSPTVGISRSSQRPESSARATGSPTARRILSGFSTSRRSACQDLVKVSALPRAERNINDKHIWVINAPRCSTSGASGPCFDRSAHGRSGPVRLREGTARDQPRRQAATAESCCSVSPGIASDGFLSARHRKKTTRSSAAIRGSRSLRGLKENVIIGRLSRGLGHGDYKETSGADPSQDIRIGDFDTGIFVDGDFGFGEMDEEEDSEALEHLDAALPGIGGGGDGDAKDDDDAASDDDVDASEGEDEEIAGDLYDDEEPSDSDDEDDIEAADDADDDTE